MLKNILIQSADIVGVRITVEGGGFVQLQMLLLHQDFDFGKLLPVHILYQGRMLRFLEEGTEISRRNPQIARYLFLGDGLVDVEADIVLGLLDIEHFSGQVQGVGFAVAEVDFREKAEKPAGPFCGAAHVGGRIINQLVDNLANGGRIRGGCGEQGQIEPFYVVIEHLECRGSAYGMMGMKAGSVQEDVFCIEITEDVPFFDGMAFLIYGKCDLPLRHIGNLDAVLQGHEMGLIAVRLEYVGKSELGERADFIGLHIKYPRSFD